MSKEYTPQQWPQQWEVEHDRGWILTRKKSGIGYSVVATVQGSSQGFTPKEFGYNTKIIAVAPDMLELLKDLCTEYRYKKKGNLKKYIEKAEDLLAWTAVDEEHVEHEQ